METNTARKVDSVTASWIAYLAKQWEAREECLADVGDQIAAIHAKLVEWGMTPETRDELDHATIAYSRVVGSYECVQWLPFDLVPNWEDDLYCVLMNEERWAASREKGQDTSKLADELRAQMNRPVECGSGGHQPENLNLGATAQR